MPDQLVSVEFRFVSSEDPDQVGERIRESVRLIAGGRLEDFRVRAQPLDPPKDRLRPR